MSVGTTTGLRIGRLNVRVSTPARTKAGSRASQPPITMAKGDLGKAVT